MAPDGAELGKLLGPALSSEGALLGTALGDELTLGPALGDTDALGALEMLGPEEGAEL